MYAVALSALQLFLSLGASLHRSEGYRRTYPALMFLIACCLPPPCRAHEIRPAIATLIVERSGKVEIRLSLNLEAYLANIGPNHANTQEAPNAAEYDRLRKLPPGAMAKLAETARDNLGNSLNLSVDQKRVPLALTAEDIPDIGDTALARVSELTFDGEVPAAAGGATWSVDERVGDSIIRLRKAGQNGNLFSEYVSRGQTSKQISLSGLTQQSTWFVIKNYIAIGYTHIIPEGLDHIFFVVGLFLLSPRLHDLLVQITCFTVAHSITLGLGMLGLISLPPSIVEPLIAASIVYVGVENVLTTRLSPWRPAIVFGFGLLHGLGFAGVLNEVGLQPAYFIAGLAAFNIGVELGQLTVVTICFAVVGFWFRSESWYRSRISVPASIAISLVAAYWFVQRVT